MQTTALLERLALTLKNKMNDLKSCHDLEFLKTAETLLQNIEFDSLNKSQNFLKQKKLVSSFLDTLKKSKDISLKCGRNSEIKSIRKPLVFAKNSGNVQNPLNQLWWKALEPACYEVYQKGNFNQVDGNACFAGDRVIMSRLFSFDEDPIDTSLRFSFALLASLANAESGSEIDIEKVYFLEFPNGSKPHFLTLLAAISTSGPSGLTGWLQGLEDRLLIRDLNLKLSNEQILKNFEDLQEAKFNYIIFRDLIDRQKITLKLQSHRVNQWNRHNMMALFLGCNLRKSFESQTKLLVWITGIAYELKDFVSHLKEKLSMQEAYANYAVDTERYRVSGAIGYDFCPVY